MAVKKTVALNNGDEAAKGNVGDKNTKRRRFNQCFSFDEVPVGQASSLKDLDPNKLKAEIKRWAKAVVANGPQKLFRIHVLRLRLRSSSALISPKQVPDMKRRSVLHVLSYFFELVRDRLRGGTSGTKRENSDLIDSRTCSITRMVDFPFFFRIV
ncbi:hypothetical protein V6N11_064173 [Hibiscus sabdariffa]|uniref:Uncharacterized protein n=1 Tax=Hibiscus sabdariffa TaxID=183260 RepID=A0ABR2PMV9_9ROSI